MRKRKRACAWCSRSLHHSAGQGAVVLAALAVAARGKMNRNSFSRLTWLVKADLGKCVLPLNVVSQINAVCVFKVQKASESCCELR